MKPTDNGEWEYVQEKKTKTAKITSNNNKTELNDLWEDMDEVELDDMDPVVTPFTVPLINSDAATDKRLANDKSKKNLGLPVQPDGQCVS